MISAAAGMSPEEIVGLKNRKEMEALERETEDEEGIITFKDADKFN